MQKLKTHHARQLLELKAEGRLTSEMDSEVPCFCCDGKAMTVRQSDDGANRIGFCESCSLRFLGEALAMFSLSRKKTSRETMFRHFEITLDLFVVEFWKFACEITDFAALAQSNFDSPQDDLQSRPN